MTIAHEMRFESIDSYAALAAGKIFYPRWALQLHLFCTQKFAAPLSMRNLSLKCQLPFTGLSHSSGKICFTILRACNFFVRPVWRRRHHWFGGGRNVRKIRRVFARIGDSIGLALLLGALVFATTNMWGSRELEEKNRRRLARKTRDRKTAAPGVRL